MLPDYQQTSHEGTRKCLRCKKDFPRCGRQTVCDGCSKILRGVLVKRLTPREAQLGEGVMRSLGNKEIAWKMGITPGSVRESLSRIYRKLGIPNRTAFALYMKARADRAKDTTAK